MQALEQALEQAAGVLLFAAAVMLLLAGAGRIDDLSDAVMRDRTEDNDIAFAASWREAPAEPEVTYAQLMALLSERIGCDIIVGGVRINAETYSPPQLPAYRLPVYAAYRQETVFRPDGTVAYVIYRGI